MLLIVSPNLCLDRILVVRDFRAGRVHRVERVIVAAGGKGLNVARAIAALGVRSTVVGFLAGEVGREILRLADSEGIRVEPVWVGGEGRVCTLIVDPAGEETVLNEPGPAVCADATDALVRRVLESAAGARMAVLCGSLPPGAPEDLYAQIITSLRTVPVVVDAAGSVLRHAVRSRPYIAKANRPELEAATGWTLPGIPDVVRAARVLQEEGARCVLVTLGSEGVVLVERTALHFRAPRVRRVHTVGAGDSLTAGLCAGLLGGRPLWEAVRWGVAAAASDVGTLRPGEIDPDRIEPLSLEVTVQPV